MTNPIKFRIDLELNGPKGTRSESLEVIAFNPPQAIRKALNMMLNRGDTVVSKKATTL